jgi:hypothetical protein
MNPRIAPFPTTALLAFLSLLALPAPRSTVAAPKDTVGFNRDIRPIMSDTCFHCHGPDAKTRKGGLRLDLREEALKPAKSGEIPIVPSKPDESEVIRRIFTHDEDDVMPPEEAHKELTPAQKELFKRWVAEGAKYEAHWAYTSLVRPAVPAPVYRKSQIVNPIDPFILEKLAEKNIQPSLEADKRTLLRRLSLDLTGLPPTPDVVEAFLKDKSARAYERQVDRLLKSPHYGERMAVWWLDVARYADTVGFHGDQNHRAFPYRDYVIEAFNRNKPFDQFTLEQLAGDLLPNATPEQLVATGFNRLNMMTREGGAQPKEYLAKYNAERARTVATTFLGATFGCAECHDHKFDPITQRDFYSLQAFFADVRQWGVYADYRYTMNKDLEAFGNEHPFPPEVLADNAYLQKRKATFEKRIAEHLKSVTTALRNDAQEKSRFNTWREESDAFLKQHPDGWLVPPPRIEVTRNKKTVPDTNAVISAGGVIDLKAKMQRGVEQRVVLAPGDARVTALRLEAFAGKEFAPESGVNVRRQGLKLTASVRRQDGKIEKVAFHHADADEKAPRYDNGSELVDILTGWELPAKPKSAKLTGVWLLDNPVRLAAGDALIVSLSGDMIVPFRLAVSPLAAVNPLASGAPAWKAAPREEAYFLSTQWNAAAFAEFKKLHRELLECRDGKAWSMVAQAAEPMTIRVLARGNWMDDSGEVQLPASPRFLPGIASTPEKRLTRLDFAKWVCSDDNPLTARTVVNRLWKQFFGNGLSAVVDDLGAQGEPPSHPELLDWLAADFRDGGWDVKRLVKQIVMSATYRQSSSLRPELADIDPGNRLLASQNPRRLEAEFVRDNALFVAGLLKTDDIGGPSVKPYQPAGYYANLQFPNRDYTADADERQWRRGLYMHWQRTFLHPMLANFDAPNRDECTANRTVSNTPQQALTLLNDPSFVEAARVFAANVLASAAKSDAARLDLVFQRAVARPARAKERESLQKFLAEQRAHYRANTEDAEKLLKVGLAPQPATKDKAELAAWTSLCRVVLNLQETVTRY